MVSKRTFRGLWLFILISFVGGLFALKAEMIIKLESILLSAHQYIWIMTGSVFLSLCVATLFYIIMSNRKRFISKKSFVFAGILQFTITFGAVYTATLIGLWLYGAISIEGLRGSFTPLDAAILLYSSFLYPILKITYDYLGIVVDDGIDFQKFHQISRAFVDRFDMNCEVKWTVNFGSEIDLMLSQLKAMKVELQNMINNHPSCDHDANAMRMNAYVDNLIDFFTDYNDKPNQRKPDMEAFFSGSETHSDTRIQRALFSVRDVRKMGQLW
jgi:hypothetical protein